jgi:hypothetical protein
MRYSSGGVGGDAQRFNWPPPWLGQWRRRTVNALVLRQYLVHTARQVRDQGLACRSSDRRVRESGISARTQRIDRFPHRPGRPNLIGRKRGDHAQAQGSGAQGNGVHAEARTGSAACVHGDCTGERPDSLAGGARPDAGVHRPASAGGRVRRVPVRQGGAGAGAGGGGALCGSSAWSR